MALKQNFLNLGGCIVNNAQNYSIGGVINAGSQALFGRDVPGASLLSNQVTDAAITVTGQNDSLGGSAWTSAGWANTVRNNVNPSIMTNGPSSLTTLVAKRGSPQSVLGNGTNYHVSFFGKAAKVLGTGKAIADVALSGALVTDCMLGLAK